MADKPQTTPPVRKDSLRTENPNDAYTQHFTAAGYAQHAQVVALNMPNDIGDELVAETSEFPIPPDVVELAQAIGAKVLVARKPPEMTEDDVQAFPEIKAMMRDGWRIDDDR